MDWSTCSLKQSRALVTAEEAALEQEYYIWPQLSVAQATADETAHGTRVSHLFLAEHAHDGWQLRRQLWNRGSTYL